MARYYRTSRANPLDYMYQANVPLMERVLEANEKHITENLTGLNNLSNAVVSFPYLSADEARAKEISDSYTKQIDEISDFIRKNPANWRNQMNPIRTLSRDLQNNYRTGEINKITDNYGKYKKVSDYVDEQVKEYNKSGKGISADRAKAYKEYFLNEFNKSGKGTGYDTSTGEYNAINVFNPMSNIDVREKLGNELEKLKAEGIIRTTDNLAGAGEYFNKQTKKWEGVTPQRILSIITGRVNDPQLLDYLRQDTQVGVVNGVFDTDKNSPNYGQLITPYTYTKLPFSSSEQSFIKEAENQIAKTSNKNAKEQLQTQLDSYVKNLNSRSQVQWNDKSYLAPIMKGLVNEYSYEKTEEENDLSANSIWSTKFSQSQANSRNRENIQAAKDKQERNFEYQKELQDDKLQGDLIKKMIDWNGRMQLAEAKNTGTKKGTTSKTGKDGVVKEESKIEPKKPVTENSIVGNITSTPYYWTTEDKDRMTLGLNNEIETTKNHVTQLNKAYIDLQKTNPDNKIMLANAENGIAAAKAKLSTLEAQRNTAIDFGINEWKVKGDKRDRSFLDKVTGQNAPINYSESNEKVLRQFVTGASLNAFSGARADMQRAEVQRTSIDKDSPEYQTFMRNTYYPAQNKLAQAQNMLTTGQRIFTEEVKPYSDNRLEKSAQNTTNRADIVQTTDNQSDRLREMINQSPSNYKILDNTGKEISLSFEHGTASTNNPDKFKINGAAITTGLGDKGVEIAATVNGKNVIIVPKDDGHLMNNYLANEFVKSKDVNVQTTGRILGSPVAGTISDMLTEVRMNTGSPYGTKDTWVYRTIPNPANPKEVVKIRTRAISTGGAEPKWEMQVETGNPQLIINNAGRGSEGYSVEDGKMKGFVPLTSTKSANGVYHNLNDILSIFPAGM